MHHKDHEDDKDVSRLPEEAVSEKLETGLLELLDD